MNLAIEFADVTEDRFDKRRLPRSVSTDNPECIAAMEREVELFREDLFFVADRQVFRS